MLSGRAAYLLARARAKRAEDSWSLLPLPKRSLPATQNRQGFEGLRLHPAAHPHLESGIQDSSTRADRFEAEMACGTIAVRGAEASHRASSKSDREGMSRHSSAAT